MKFLIVVASSRSDGNTAKLSHVIADSLQAEIIDLQNLSISYFDYQNRNKSDSFIPLIERIVSSDFVVFATPVYWYSMSAQMKTLFDRFTDLLTINKKLGRRLRGLPISVIATGTDEELPSSFKTQFELISDYLGLVYHEPLYCSCQGEFNFQQHQKAIQGYLSRISLQLL
ncbi:flavodoxin family protein [Alteromonas portus]|uniref:flavodoxin family protein n=1 Tax=Alteromonas portus TaxID=2565549 RepID=UPI003BF84C1B